MKSKIFLAILFLFLLFPSNIFAQELTTCVENSYPENGFWMKKTGCYSNQNTKEQCFLKNGQNSPKCQGDLAEICFCDIVNTNQKVSDNPSGPNNLDSFFGRVEPPPAISSIGFGSSGLGKFFGNIIKIIYAVAGIAFIFMIVWGAFQWIISGGDKESIAKARARIMQAIVGIVILALAALIITIFGNLTGFKFFNTASPPTATSLCSKKEIEECAKKEGFSTCIRKDGKPVCLGDTN
ncbi:hypothetical protein HYS93_01155 [Candidatus Daviesbacteria bacterium]|nr:hypothetical protein [Candidatus Daviesbacteria bacterium]